MTEQATRGRPRSAIWDRAPVIVAAYQAGATAKEMATWFHVDDGTIRKILAESGVIARRGRPRRS